MTTKVVPGQLVAVPDLESLARDASNRFARALGSQRCRSAMLPEKSGLARSHPTQSFMQRGRGEPIAVILSNDTECLSARGRGQSTTVHSIYKLCFISDADICAGCAKLKNGVVGWGSWRK